MACLADSAADLANVVPLQQLGIEVHAIPMSRMAARARAAAALLSWSPLTNAYFREPKLAACVARILREQPVDAAVVFSSGMAQFVEPYDQLPRFMHFCDLDSFKWEQYAESMRAPKKWLYQLEAGRLLAYERRIAAQFEHSFVCTPVELRDFRQLIPEATSSCLRNGVDLDYFCPTPLVTPSPGHLIFTGVMDYHPNVDAVLWFCAEVFPRIREQVPTATFTICGTRPTAEVRALGQIPGVTVTGRVPDVRPYLQAAEVCVVPLRIARGIQNKLLEAMAMGLPVVSTTKAYEGTEAIPGTHLLTADEAPHFASRVIQLLTDHELRQRVRLAARQRMEDYYDWNVPLAELEQLLVASYQSERALDTRSGSRKAKLPVVKKA